MRGYRSFIWICCLFASSLSLATEGGLLRLAGSTTVVDSGLLNRLQPRFLADTGYRIRVYPAGTGHALKLGRMGRVDVLLTHSPAAEAAFVDEGYGIQRLPVMHNHFVLVGPAADPAGISGSDDAAAALQRIASAGLPFLSRGDDSGTHNKEQEIWQWAGIDPYGSRWYRETGEAMSRTLSHADNAGAYTLTDQGSWLAMSGQLSLKSLVSGGPRLLNAYHVIAVNPARNPDVDLHAAETFIRWIRSPQIQQLIADYRKDGESYFVPDALP